MQQSFYDRVVNLVLRGMIGLALLLPYGPRVRLIGALTRGVVAPLAGYMRRSRENLALIFPDLPEAERDRIARAAVDNAGRTLVEIFSGRAFVG